MFGADRVRRGAWDPPARLVVTSTASLAEGQAPFGEPLECYDVRPIGEAARRRGGAFMLCCDPNGEDPCP